MNTLPSKFHLPQEVILWGGTGQAKIVRPIIDCYGSRVIAVFDDTKDLCSPFPDLEIYCGWPEFIKWIDKRDRSKIGFCVTIGNPHGMVRAELSQKLAGTGLCQIQVIHPEAWIAPTAKIGNGVQIMANAVIQTDATVGDYCIINANTYVDHDAVVGDMSELVAGSQMMGYSKTGENSLIGASSIILSRISIGKNVCIGASVVVSENVPDNSTLIFNGWRPQ